MAIDQPVYVGIVSSAKELKIVGAFENEMDATIETGKELRAMVSSGYHEYRRTETGGHYWRVTIEDSQGRDSVFESLIERVKIR